MYLYEYYMSNCWSGQTGILPYLLTSCVNWSHFDVVKHVSDAVTGRSTLASGQKENDLVWPAKVKPTPPGLMIIAVYTHTLTATC